MKLPRNIDRWIGPYLKRYGLCPRIDRRVKTVVICLADHFEPHHGGVDDAQALSRVNRWIAEWPEAHDALRGDDGVGNAGCWWGRPAAFGTMQTSPPPADGGGRGD